MYFVCCQILGVKPGADLETIKNAYRKSAKELHPDINDSEKAHEYFLILKNAYEYLLSHQYSEAELRILWQREQLKKIRQKTGHGKHEAEHFYHPPPKSAAFTLREVLKESRTARVLYLLFHVLFLFVGGWLIYHSVYDMLFHRLEDHSNLFSAYFTIIFGFFFGLILTSTFLVTGITYLRNR